MLMCVTTLRMRWKGWRYLREQSTLISIFQKELKTPESLDSLGPKDFSNESWVSGMLMTYPIDFSEAPEDSCPEDFSELFESSTFLNYC